MHVSFKAEVGGFGDEQVRGMSEFSVAGFAAQPATLSFQVFQLGGLFRQLNYSGLVDVFAYAGNGVENVTDYDAAPLLRMGSFNTANLVVNDTIRLDATTALSAATTAGSSWLGVRMQLPSSATSQTITAITFDRFQLSAQAIPEPSTCALLAAGLLPLAGIAGRRRKA